MIDGWVGCCYSQVCVVVSQFVDYPEFHNAIAECGFYNRKLLPKVSVFCSGHISGSVVKDKVVNFCHKTILVSY